MGNRGFPLLILPEELILDIVRKLDKRSLSRLERTCRRLHRICRPELLKIAKEIGRPEQSLYDRFDVKIREGNDVRSGLTQSQQQMAVTKLPRQYLSRAVEVGAYQSVAFFLEAGLSANTFDLESYPMLHLAIATGHVDITKLLLEKGADVTLTRKAGQTPLDMVYYAPLEAQGELARLLLEAGSKVNNMPCFLKTILGTECPADLLGRVLKMGLNIHTWRDGDHGYTALHIAAQVGNSCKLGGTEAVACVLHHAPELLNKFSFDDPPHQEKTALRVALDKWNHTKAVYLIQRGSTLARGRYTNPCRKAAFQLLTQAACQRSADVVRALLARPELDGFDFKDWTLNGGREPFRVLFQEPFLGNEVDIMKLLIGGRRFPYDPSFINACRDMIIKKAWTMTVRKDGKELLRLLEEAMLRDIPTVGF
ncbi:hypothetical protein ASPCADRAFT_4121 [Aspergillus carbonarius ITEM 5010]|uniref:F-box domain-containing protein n=1 Tax=Aspergillus carbonarius (strain ITEM 5010) TaxID=602072 RepID=A0A1R3RSS8_ASPC5|nr:hypothetical protein ASPCADRAFT_4121 [Aspergillus carbonarius ITEM 5010]